MAERRGSLTEGQSAAFLRALGQFPISGHLDSAEAEVMALARRYRLTVYDAAYLELALREGISLATLDSAFANAARAEKTSLLGE